MTCSGIAAVFAVAMAGVGLADGQSTASIDGAFVEQAVESAAALIEQELPLDPPVASRAAAALRGALRQGRYGGARTPGDLAMQLTSQLFTLTHDRHLAVSVVAAESPAKAGAPPDDVRDVRGRRANFGVQRVEILSGNVGYLNLTAFYRRNEAVDAIAAAMRALRNADALIIDMRDNGGGSPDSVALVASYLFDAAGIPLFEIVPRTGNPTRYTTEGVDAADRKPARATFILTSSRTFSAGEGFAFLMQDRNRAEVIGERTAGAANPGRPYRINDRLEVTIPNGQVRMAVGGRNWEGTGVVPDIPVTASAALTTAHQHALATLAKTTPPGAWRDTLERLRLGTEGLPDFSGTWILSSVAIAAPGTPRRLIVDQRADTIHVTRVSDADTESEEHRINVSGGIVASDGSRMSSGVRRNGNALMFEKSTCRAGTDVAETCVYRSEEWRLESVPVPESQASPLTILRIQTTTGGPGNQGSGALLIYHRQADGGR